MPFEEVWWQAIQARDGKATWWQNFGTEAEALAALDAALTEPHGERADWHGTSPEALVKESLAKVKARLESQDLGKELKFMADIREAVPADMQWDAWEKAEIAKIRQQAQEAYVARHNWSKQLRDAYRVLKDVNSK